MNVKKYTNNTWQEITLYKYSTSVETYTDLPQIIYANGNSASISLKGALSQSGVPSPTNPIQPQGCGDLETTGEHTGQYKIPISSASTTTPVYLGEVETTRRIRKLVLTGEEAIEIKSGNARWYIPIADMKTPTNTSVIEWYCSHYQAVANSASWTSYDYMISWSTADSGTSIGLRIRDIDFLTGVTVSDFKTYLQQQYAAGTPVTVWYVLATEETAVVNEPLMKIGDYADTVSGITVPTITGEDSFDVETTLKPSEVTLAYTGWHDATVKEWDGSQWNE